MNSVKFIETKLDPKYLQFYLDTVKEVFVVRNQKINNTEMAAYYAVMSAQELMKVMGFTY